MTTATPPFDPHEQSLVALLVEALRLAGRAGSPVAASRLAARAWWSLSNAGDAPGAQRINAVMHLLARLPPEEDLDSMPAPPPAQPPTQRSRKP